MARYSPTVDTSAYDDGGGDLLGQYLEHLRTKQYYDYLREDRQARTRLAEQARDMELLNLGLERPELTYSPNRVPGRQRGYMDPVLAGPSLQEPGLAGSLQQEMAEPGKPVALAGELLPGGGGFAARNIYRQVPENPARYDEIAPGLYQDLQYGGGLGDELAALGTMTPEQATIAERLFEMRQPGVMPGEWLQEEPSMIDQYREAYLADAIAGVGRESEFAMREREAQADQARRMQLEDYQESLFRSRPRAVTSAGGSTSLTNNPLYQAVKAQVSDYGIGGVTDEFARSLGLRDASEAIAVYTTGQLPERPVSSGQTSVEEIMEGARRTLEMFGPTPGPMGSERRSDTTSTRRRR